jgi:hypothetical protein
LTDDSFVLNFLTHICNQPSFIYQLKPYLAALL